MKGKSINEIEIGDTAYQRNHITINNADAYAKITGDCNPIHFDTEEAKSSRYGAPIAHGMILAGFISGVIGSKLPGAGCIYESQKMHFMRPVYYGDVITTIVRVKEMNKERNRITLDTICKNKNNEIVLTGEAIVLPRK